MTPIDRLKLELIACDTIVRELVADIAQMRDGRRSNFAVSVTSKTTVLVLLSTRNTGRACPS